MMRKNDQGKARLLLLGNATQAHLKRWAAYFSDNGYDVFTLSLERATDFPTRYRKCWVPGLLPGFIRYPLAVPQVRDVVATFKPDIINAHFLPNYGVIAALIRKKPWILSTWGSDIMMLPEKSPFHMKRTRYVLERASFITSDAEVMTKRLTELGVSHGRILTVPFGVDLSVFTPRGGEGISDKPRIVSCRKLEHVYNVRTLIEAFPIVKAELPDAALTIAGDGSQKKKLVGLAQETGYRDDILFVGDVDHDKLPALLREHNIYVSTALSDTTSVSLLEAMACGLYPVVTNIPANRDWIVDGTNGTRVPPSNPDELAGAIIAAWRDMPSRIAAKNHNEGIIKKRADWHQNMALVNELFQRIIEEERGLA